MNALKYRSDIDGLRAVAVLAVLLFHLDPGYLKAGYLGVDIFFVISGYLITRIVYTEVMERKYTFTNFYVRRSKRILPPLYFMIILTLIAAYIILLPYDFFKTGISIAAAILFVSNMQFALRTGDYFSSDSSEWPMLHTWSLSVEEQYYFILPIALIFFIKYLRLNLLAVLVVVALASFVLAEYMSARSSLAGMSYYILLTRMGELLVGSVLAILHARGTAKSNSTPLATLAAAILLATLIFFDKQLVFPGFSALLACLPIAMIIHTEGTWVNRLLENKLVVWIGLLSYSLYLFHWPVLAFARYILNTTEGYLHLPLVTQAICLVLIFALSTFSYYAVERPLRRTSIVGIKALILYFVIPSAALVLLAAGVVLKKGMPERFSTDTIDTSFQFSHIDKNQCPSLVNLGCVGGDKESETDILLYGNSHAEHHFELLSLLAKDSGKRIKMYASGGCGLTKKSAKCDSTLSAYSEALEQGTELSILAFRWDQNFDNEEYLTVLDELIRQAQASSERVIVMAQPPLLNFSPSKIENCNRLGVPCPKPANSINDLFPAYNDAIAQRVTALGAEFFDPYVNIEDSSQLYEEDRLLYSDMDHLSVYGGRWLYQQLTKGGAAPIQF
jgi:peptidoglycan/LPS O-acetylase OafA/YrhL